MAEKEPGQRLFEMYMGANGRKYHVAPFCEVDPDRREEWARAETAFEAPLLAEIERLKTRVAELEADRASLVERCVDAMMNGKLCGKHMAEWIKLFERVGPKAISEILDHCDGCVREERDQLRTKAEELEKERDGIVDKLREAIELAGTMLYGSEKGLSDTEAALRLHALQTYHASLAQELPPDLPLRTLDTARIPDLNRDEHLDRPKPEQDHVHEVGSCSFCDRALRQGSTPCLTWQEPEYGGRCRACGGSKEEHEGRGQ